MSNIDHSYQRDVEKKMMGLNASVKKIGKSLYIDIPDNEGVKTEVNQGVAQKIVEQSIPNVMIDSVKSEKGKTRIKLKDVTEMTES